MNNLSSICRAFLLMAFIMAVPFSSCWAQREGQKELLDRAYWEKSVEKLQQFFENWADEIRKWDAFGFSQLDGFGSSAQHKLGLPNRSLCVWDHS